jgi:hypothetical protein
MKQVVDRVSLVSELSVTTGQEKLMLDECRELLSIAAKLQVLNCQCFQVFSERILLLVCQTTPLTFVLILSANIKGPKRYVRLRACLFELILFKTWILKLQVKANFWIGFWIN